MGAPEAVPTPSRYPLSVSFSRDGKSLVYVRYESMANLQSVAFDASAGKVTGEPAWVTRGFTGISHPQLSPNGEHYVARWPRLTQEDIAIFNKDGSNWRALTDDKFQDRRPRWFPGGRRSLSVPTAAASTNLAINATARDCTTYFADGTVRIRPFCLQTGEVGLPATQEQRHAAFVIDLTKGWQAKSRTVAAFPVRALVYFHPDELVVRRRQTHRLTFVAR